MRMFVALVPPVEAVEHLDEFLAVRREAAPFRWTLPEQVHVTLAFLAEVPDRALEDLVERLARAAARRTPVATRIAGGGAFPNPARARVLWAGLGLDDVGRTEVGRMATGARAAASRAGVAVDGQRFRPHLTVARLGRPAEVSSWVRLLDSYDGPAWTADTVSLVASHLGEGPRNRPRYELVEQLPVG
ncbi:RNA 2',3'-cyclic phosphodiesterase [Nocardioides euryhalodurans]|uniref:RNA 2',3'-cyclic phosphodiesterase n=1 Tax=Nocardioides euryhalodurans TaxID=2518370 RepID=A0A4P7GLE8_9ACTN|nr:RNA 2',3'-cyclic phosphodiesterase [Nocardioides euryhalodurans]QBR92679.1 RNA 2',3'-cyclic phosphodiesterase [Nocardioides euryhalodurans]